MKLKLLSVLFLLSALTFGGIPHKSNSILATGKWYKIAVQQTGIYKITYENFVNMGFDPSQVNDSNIRIYGNGGGMLPEKNSDCAPPGRLQTALARPRRSVHFCTFFRPQGVYDS